MEQYSTATGIVLSVVSLVLAIIFWWDARKQSQDAGRALNEIKTQIIGWQSELNKAAIDMLSARPEMIAQKTALKSSQAETEFAKRTADLVEHLGKADSKGNLDAIAILLNHQKDVVLGKQAIGFDAATRGRGL